MKTGTGTFIPAANVNTRNLPRFIAVGDFNGDNKVDLAITIFSSGSVAILLGTGTGNFSAPTNVFTVGAPSRIVVADFNGDNKSDLAVGSGGSRGVLLGVGRRHF